MSALKMTSEGERQILVVRRFAGPPETVFRAHLEPDLIRQWMLGPEGWTMPVCESEAVAGGKFRFRYVDGGDGEFSITGEYLEIVPCEKVVHIERMHLPDPTPENHVETHFAADGSGTLLTVRMTLPDEATRRAMLDSGMNEGMEASYSRLDRVTR